MMKKRKVQNIQATTVKIPRMESLNKPDKRKCSQPRKLDTSVIKKLPLQVQKYAYYDKIAPSNKFVKSKNQAFWLDLKVCKCLKNK